MSQRVYINELKNHIGETVQIKGHIYALRIQGSVSFLVARDITGTVQTVIVKATTPDVFEFIKGLSLESCIAIEGLVKNEPKAKGGVEIEATKLDLISACAPELPIPVYEKGNEAQDEARYHNRFLDIRKPKNALIMKLSAAFDQYYREFFNARGFFEIHTPKMMPTPSESSSDLFEVEYFDRKAYLAQSPQLYKQMAIAAGMEKVFEVGPIFRAEKSFTSRHATECTCFDVEIAHITDHHDLIKLEAELMVFIFSKIKERYGEEIKTLFDIDLTVPTLPFPEITMREAKELLHSKVPDGDLSSEEEKALGEHFAKQGHDFVFVTDFPISARPFYHKYYTDKPCTKSADLLYKGLEITTLAQREEHYDVLVEQLKSKGLKTEGIQWYLDFFKYGTPPHGGWGIGSARVLVKMLNLDSIREAMFIFRGVNQLFP